MFWCKKKTVDSNNPSKQISFEYFDPAAKTVSLCGDFNGWDTKATPLKRDKTGRWKVSLSLNPGRYEYKFFIDGQWCYDQRPVYLVQNAFGSQNCLIEV